MLRILEILSVTDIYTIITLYNQRNIDDVAAILNVHPRSISSRLEKISEEIGVKLFAASNNGPKGTVDPLPDAERIVPILNDMIALGNKAFSQYYENDPAKAGHEINIGVVEFFEFTILDCLEDVIRAEMPNISVQYSQLSRNIYSDRTQDLDQAKISLEHGHIDLLIYLHYEGLSKHLSKFMKFPGGKIKPRQIVASPNCAVINSSCQVSNPMTIDEYRQFHPTAQDRRYHANIVADIPGAKEPKTVNINMATAMGMIAKHPHMIACPPLFAVLPYLDTMPGLKAVAPPPELHLPDVTICMAWTDQNEHDPVLKKIRHTIMNHLFELEKKFPRIEK